jgi:hypothetical protein
MSINGVPGNMSVNDVPGNMSINGVPGNMSINDVPGNMSINSVLSMRQRVLLINCTRFWLLLSYIIK